ncbi:phage terminase small subunit P27 family [Marinifilum flexuosum]|uniref:phage terminase small subunit P27 family n=1 Tax=Marinifilum flexuosum TaxID=1117708 RepID=UPI0024951919|nr:phage terminase small subunit P27 family [Marinifilum flexuosum]
MKSIEQHKADGTYRKDRHKNKIDQSGFRVNEIPGCEDLPERAQDFFTELAALQIKSGQLTEVDIPALKILATSYSDYFDAVETLDIEGLIVGDDSPKLHPMNQVKKDAREFIFKLLREFGMTPTSRTRIISTDNIPQTAEEDDLTKLRKR